MKTASPGATSRSTEKPSASSATDSLATTYSVPPIDSLTPMINGRMPNGSRKASSPYPAHRDDRIRAAAALVHGGNRGEDRVGVELGMMRRALELQSEDVEQDFGIRIGVDVAEIELEQLALQFLAVGQIAVVRERDAERRVDVERLRLEVGRCRAGRRVAAVADARAAHQFAHVARAKDVAHVAGALVHVEDRAFAGDDAGRVLAAVLQQQEPVVE